MGTEGWERDWIGQSLERSGPGRAGLGELPGCGAVPGPLGSGSCQAAELLPEEKRLPHRSALPCDCEMNALNIGRVKTFCPK